MCSIPPAALLARLSWTGRPGPERHSETATQPQLMGTYGTPRQDSIPLSGWPWEHTAVCNTSPPETKRWQVHLSSQLRQLQLPGPLKPKARRGRDVIWAPNADAPKHPHLFNQSRDGALGGAGLDSILYKKTRTCLIRDRGRRGRLRRLCFWANAHIPRCLPPLHFLWAKAQTLLEAQSIHLPSATTPALANPLESLMHPACF